MPLDSSLREIRLHMTAADSVDAYRLNHAVVLRRRWVHVWLPLLLAGLSMFYGTVYATTTGQTIAHVLEIFAALSLLTATVLLLTFWLVVPMRARRNWRQNPLFREELLLTFDNEALTVAQPSARGQRQWSSYRCWAENSSTFLLFNTDHVYSYLPKRVLSDGDVVRLRGALDRAGVPRVWALTLLAS